MQLGRAVRRLRRDRDLTQGQLADRVGLNRTSVTNIEKGSQALSVSLLVKLARSMDADPVQILQEALLAADEAAAGASPLMPSEVETGVASPALRGWVLELLQDGEPDSGQDRPKDPRRAPGKALRNPV